MPHALVVLMRRIGAGAGAALAILLLLTVIHLPPPLPAVLAVLFGLAALAAWRIDLALLLLAVAVPVARVAGRAWAPAATWPEMLAVAVIAGWFCRRVVSRDRLTADFDGPIAAAAAIVLASLFVVTTLGQWRLTGALVTPAWLETYWRGYFLMESSGDPVDTAMRLLEMLVLFRAAAYVAARSPSWVPRMGIALAAGAVAAAAINVWAVGAASAGQGSSLTAFVHALLTARVNVHYADVNAASSYFVMMLAVAIGLAVGGAGRRPDHDSHESAAVGGRRQATETDSGSSRKIRWSGGALAAAVVIAGGLWVSGSRTAVMAGLLAAALPVAARRGASLRRGYVAIAALLILAAAASAYLLPHRGTQRSANDALRVRYELSKSSVRMLATAPVFGVGVGNYFPLSGQFASRELLTLFPPAVRENAHNYYLQLLAELGLAGFAVCGWLVWICGRRVSWLLAGSHPTALAWGMVIGILAFALTCVGGHPLLIDEPAFTFALLAGAVVGWGEAIGAPRRAGEARAGSIGSTATRRFAAVLVLVVLATVPFRWYSARAAMDLSDIAFGLTGWYTGRDGVAYRLAGRSCLIYVPADFRAITVPLRATHPHDEVDLVIRVDGATVEQMRIRSDGWQVVRIPLPPAPGAGRFRRLDLEVLTPAQTPRVLFIGRITPI